MLSLHMNAVRIKEKQLARLNLSEWIMEEKFKGIRVWRNKTPKGVTLITRGGENITENFPHLVEIDWTPGFAISQLDCELYDPEQEDEVVSGWANTISIDPDKTANCVLKVFDVLTLHDQDLSKLPQIERKRILSGMRLRGPCQEVPWFPADEHRAYYEHILSRKGEGIMLKRKAAPYVENARRVSLWFKKKKRDSYDCIVLGFTKAKEGKFSGLIGAVTVGQYLNGIIRPLCNVSGMADNVRKDMTLHPENYIGRPCSIWAASQDKNSLALIEPSWHSIRVDKRPEECIVNFEHMDEPEEDKLCEL